MLLIAKSLVDVTALWHVALYSLLGAVGLTGSYGTFILATERARTAPAWRIAAVLAATACVVVLAIGLWAMTQK